MSNQIGNLKMGQKFKKTPAGEIPVEWESVRIGDLLDYERPDKYIVKSTDYSKSSGDGVPVLTANKSFVLGYTSEDFGIYRGNPVILFDDFTADSKYVDFPFKVKSSAIKILKPKAGVNLKYIFEVMQIINFTVGDHKRYYISEYQNVVVPVPPFSEQEKVSKVLSDIDALISGQKKYLDAISRMKSGLMSALLTGKVRMG